MLLGTPALLRCYRRFVKEWQSVLLLDFRSTMLTIWYDLGMKLNRKLDFVVLGLEHYTRSIQDQI